MSVVSDNMISIKVEVMMKFVLELLKVVETIVAGFIKTFCKQNCKAILCVDMTSTSLEDQSPSGVVERLIRKFS